MKQIVGYFYFAIEPPEDIKVPGYFNEARDSYPSFCIGRVMEVISLTLHYTIYLKVKEIEPDVLTEEISEEDYKKVLREINNVIFHIDI